jgi:hypothetical protein
MLVTHKYHADGPRIPCASSAATHFLRCHQPYSAHPIWCAGLCASSASEMINTRSPHAQIFIHLRSTCCQCRYDGGTSTRHAPPLPPAPAAIVRGGRTVHHPRREDIAIAKGACVLRRPPDVDASTTTLRRETYKIYI